MVFSDEAKAIIKNDYLEYGWTAYNIVKNHSAWGWNKVSVQRLINRYNETGTMDRKKGSGRPRTATDEANTDEMEELICSQEENPGTHSSPREIGRDMGVSHMSVRRAVKSRGINNFKRLKTPQMDQGTRKRRVERAKRLAGRFESNPRMIKKAVWQDEKDFTFQVPTNSQNNRVYRRGNKSNVPEENLFHPTKKLCKKLMVSACVSWYGATQPFFVNEKGLKVNGVRYHKHLQKDLIPAIEKVVKRDDWMFVQDGAPSHRSKLVQNFMKTELKHRFVTSAEWPPASPDCNPLDYIFWDAVKSRVYEGRLNKPFLLKARIKTV